MRRLTLSAEDERHPVIRQRLNATKSVTFERSPLDPKQLATDAIAATTDGPALIIVNTVGAAQDLYRQIKALAGNVILIHSRYRFGDRPTLDAINAVINSGGIVVGTQAIECGIDISARTLFTEVAPWTSMVQRIGRCNRAGEFSDAAVHVYDVEKPHPYANAQLETTREILATLDRADIQSLSKVKCQPEAKKQSGFTRSALEDFFHTDTDIQGSRTDPSPYIRDTNDYTVSLVYRAFDAVEDGKMTPDRGLVKREECVSVPITKARDFLKKNDGYTWNPLGKQYVKVEPAKLGIGTAVIVHFDCGGYSQELGFTGNPKDKTAPVNVTFTPNDSINADHQSAGAKSWLTLTQHSLDAAREARKLLPLIPEEYHSDFLRAAQWHDCGKAHPEWQIATKRSDAIYAKFRDGGRFGRVGIRHELASMLIARQSGLSTLAQFLILCHHGKVRTMIQPLPKEHKPDQGLAYARGIWDKDRINCSINLGDGVVVPPMKLQLKDVISWNGQWTEDIENLLSQHGPFVLSYLEAMVRLADWRASANPGGDNDAVA